MATRHLQVIDGQKSGRLKQSLSDALSGAGPAVFLSALASPSNVPSTVNSDVALVVETSGSTQKPKRVWHTSESLLTAARQSNAELGGRGVWWRALPSHYIAGAMVSIRALESGGFVLSMDRDHSLADNLINFVKKANQDAPLLPRFTSLVPKQLAELLEIAQRTPEVAHALASFARILVGGQRVPEPLMAQAEELGLAVTRTYGAAETAGGCIWDGKPLRETEVAIINNRIAVSGPMLAGGYLGDAKRTARQFVTSGGQRWFLTDDVGDFSEGELAVLGRADRVIISGGEKTNLDEVEAALCEEFNTSDIVTIPVTREPWGESIGVVSTRDLKDLSVERFLRNRFGKAARLAWTDTVSSLPRLSSGKVNLHELEKRYGSGKLPDTST